MPLQPKPFMALMDVHAVLPGEITFCKTQIVNRIQQIGFAHAIAAANTHNALVELELLVKIIFELEKRYGVQAKTQLFRVCNFLLGSNIELIC